MRQRLTILATCAAIGMTALGCGSALASGDAPASRFPAWRLTWKSLGDGLKSVTAISKNDAWAVGINKHGAGYILHWTGHRWRHAGLPAAGFLPLTIRASSATNVWVLGDYAGGFTADRWDGSRWHQITLPAGAGSDAVILSANDAWLAEPSCQAAICQVYHWKGSTWTEIVLPRHFTLQSLSGFSDTSIWVAGYLSRSAGSGPVAAYRWTGRSWLRAHLPRLGIGATAEVVAVSPANVWVVNTWILYPRPAHWNGKNWSSAPRPPYALSAAGPVVPYGRHGLRVGATSIWTGHSWLFGSAPGDGANAEMTAIPGTLSAWMATAWFLPGGLTAEILHSP
jgi:hypothetical protein